MTASDGGVLVVATVVVGTDPGLAAGPPGSAATSGFEGSMLARCAASLSSRGPVEVGLVDPAASSPLAVAWVLRWEHADGDGGTEELAPLVRSGTTARWEVETVGDTRRVPGARSEPGAGDRPRAGGVTGAEVRRAGGEGGAGPGVLRSEPGMRKVTFHARLPGTSPDHYRRRFRAHLPIAEVHHANARRYRQSVVVAGEARTAGVLGGRRIDGISEHWYAGVAEARARHFARPDSEEVVRSDVAEWLDVPGAVVSYATCWTSAAHGTAGARGS